jgi:hypothetical protein
MNVEAAEQVEHVAEACDMNLGPRQRRRRLMTGYIFGGLVVVAAVLLLALHAPRLARLALFAPLVVSVMGFVQYRAKT